MEGLILEGSNGGSVFLVSPLKKHGAKPALCQPLFWALRSLQWMQLAMIPCPELTWKWWHQQHALFYQLHGNPNLSYVIISSCAPKIVTWMEKAENDQKNTILTPPELLLPRVNWVLLSACVCNSEVLWKLISVEDQPRILLHAQLAKFSSLTSSLLPLCFRPQESLPLVHIPASTS